MTDLKKAAQQALEALDQLTDDVDGTGLNTKPSFDAALLAITALKAALEQQAEPPPEWESIKNILDEYGLDAIAFATAWKAVQQRAEPVAWQVMVEDEALKEFSIKDMAHDWCVRQKLSGSSYTYWIRPLYTTPHQRQWVGLEPEEILDLFDRNNVYGSKWIEFARTVEAKLKEKNSD